MAPTLQLFAFSVNSTLTAPRQLAYEMLGSFEICTNDPGGQSVPHPNHEIQDPRERKAAAELLRLMRRAPKSTMEWLLYEKAKHVQRRRRALKTV